MTNFSFYSFLLLLGCIGLGAGYAWLLYHASKYLEKRLKISLSIIRTITVATLAWLLFAPLMKLVSYTPEKPIIVIANDNSQSIGQVKPKDFDAAKYEADLKELRDKLADKYEVKSYHFSDSVKGELNFSNDGKLTNGAALFKQLNDEFVNRNVGAVILASDGIFNRGGNPAYETNQINAPIYTIALGDTIPKRDVLIANVNYNNLVYLDNEFVLDVQIQAFAAKNEKIKLAVKNDGVTLSEQLIAINSSSFVKDVAVKLKANKIGIHKYELALSALPNEITTKNNSQTIFVEVIDGRQKILIAAAGAHPDIATLKHAIEANKHYEVEVLLGDDLVNAQLNKYNLVICYQLPGNATAGSVTLAKLKSSALPIWYILGAQSDVTGFNQMQSQVNISKNGTTIQETFAVQNEGFSTFVVSETALTQLKDYDPLLVPYGTTLIKDNAQVLLNQRIGKVNTKSPLWFFLTNNSSKCAYLLGEGIWKWKLEEAKDERKLPLVNELIVKTIQYLSAKDDKRKFRVYGNKNTFEESENVVLNAVLYNDAYEAVNSAEVKLQLKNAEGKIFNFNFSKSGNAYLLDMGNLPQGNYTYLASTSLGDKKYTANGAFYVNALIAEFQQTTANHQLLNTMASQTGGKMYMPNQISSIADDLEKSGTVKTISYEDHKYEELINIKWIFILVMVLLSTEWFLRKRNGEI